MTVCKGAYRMIDDERKINSRSENKRRQRQRNNRMDRVLNYLIAIVIVLICISSYMIFFTGDKEEVQPDEQNGQITNNTESNELNESNETDNSNIDEGDDEQGDKQEEDSSAEVNQDDSSNSAIVSPSTDPIVSEVIVDPNWQPTATAQTGPHTSVFAKGHIDYEEKLATIFSVTSLSEENSILWKITNNGSPDTAIAVISSKDKEQKYRVSIEWVPNEGWKPVKLEKLKTLEGLY